MTPRIKFAHKLAPLFGLGIISIVIMMIVTDAGLRIFFGIELIGFIVFVIWSLWRLPSDDELENDDENIS